MNKLFTKIAGIALGLSMAIVVGAAVASNAKEASRVDAAETITNTITFGSGDKIGSYTSSFDETDSALIGWTISKFNNNNWNWSSSVSGANKSIKVGNKTAASVGTIQNKAELSNTKFTKVDLYISARTSTYINSITVYGGSTSSSVTTQLATVSDATPSTTNPTVLTLSNQSNYKYYKIAFDMKKHSSSNGLLTLDKVCWYQNTSTPVTAINLSGTGVTGSNPNYSYNIASSSDTTQKTITVGLNPTTATDPVVKVEHYSGTSGLLTFDSTVTCSNGSGSFHFTGKENGGTEKFKLYGNTETSVITYLEVSIGTYYTVTFNANGGSSTPASESVEDGSTFTFPSAPGTKEHYSFDGWTSTGDEPYYAAGATSPAVTGNITYTAHWTEDAKYTVTYSAASPGSGSYAHNNNYGGTYTLLPFASLSGITYDSDVYQFKNYTVGGVNKNPGDTFTLSAATTVTVNFEEIPPVDNITYAKTAGIRGNSTSSWGTAGSVSDTTGAVYFLNSMGVSDNSSAVRWNGNGYLYATSAPSGMKLKSVSIASISSEKSIHVYASNTAYSAAPSGTSLGSLSNDALSFSFDDSYKFIALKGTASSTEVGTISITYEPLPVLDSVTTSGQKATFSAGEKFSYGGTLTAHYTNGKADATVTPASYKVGASGIDPTSAGTAITAATTMTIDAHNGKYIYVVYAEDNITKWASYQITVNPAAPTAIVLSSSSTTIGVDETFSFTDVEVTINPSAYATQNAYEWVMVDDLGLDVEFDYPDIVVHEDSNGEPLIIRCRSTVDNSVYADFELTVSANPIAVLYDANDQDVTGGTASYYADYGNDIYYHVSATNFGTGVSYTWSSSNTSILSVDDNDGASCGYYIENGASGTARLSCVISGSKGSVTVYVDVTITAVSVSAVTWTAPTIDVFSGATLSASDTSSWNVKYSTNSGKTNLTPDSFNVKLGGSTIFLPHTWVAADHGKTLCVEVGGVSSSTTTVAVTQSINNVYQETFSSNSSDLTFTAACGGSGTADDSKAWTVTSDGTESSFDTQNGKGIHYGTSGAAVQYIKLTSNDFTSGKITKVEVNASTASGVSATVSVKVGGEAFGGDPQDLTSSAVPDNPYTFTGNADADTIEVLITKPSSATKALYCKSIVVTYETSSGSKNIANNASHKAAQRAAVAFAQAFNAAMDETENCTTGLDDAWATCSSAYTSFKNAAAALGSTEEAYALNLIKYATAQYSDDSGEACIERMMKTYEICVQRHGKTAFMSDLVTLQATRVTPYSIFGNTNNMIPAIVVISMISVTAVGGYFFLRKRKED